jgi:hypothetical protein
LELAKSAAHGAGYSYQAGGSGEKRKRADCRKLVMDLPPGQRRRECAVSVGVVGIRVAKLARVHIMQWASRAERMLGGGKQ